MKLSKNNVCLSSQPSRLQRRHRAKRLQRLSAIGILGVMLATYPLGIVSAVTVEEQGTEEVAQSSEVHGNSERETVATPNKAANETQGPSKEETSASKNPLASATSSSRPQASQPVVSAQETPGRSAFRGAGDAEYPLFNESFWNDSDSDAGLYDNGFINFRPEFRSDETVSDGFAWNTPENVVFPGSKGTFKLMPYNFWAAFNRTKNGYRFSQSPLYAFYVVLPAGMVATSTRPGQSVQDAVQAGADRFKTVLNSTRGIEPGSVTSVKAIREGQTPDGREVWIFIPNPGAKYAVRTTDPDQFPVVPTLEMPVKISDDYKDLNGNLVTDMRVNAATQTGQDSNLEKASLFAILPRQYWKYTKQTGRDWLGRPKYTDFESRDLTIFADAMMDTRPTASVSPDYSTFKAVPSWAADRLADMKRQLGYEPGFTLATYNGHSGDGWSWRFKPFVPSAIDEFTVMEGNRPLNIGNSPIQIPYAMQLNDGRYEGNYELSASKLNFEAIRRAGYRVTKVDLRTQKRVGSGANLSWTDETEQLWTSGDDPTFTGKNVQYKLPIDTTKQWFTTIEKSDELKTRHGVIHVEKIKQAPLHIKVVDFREKPLANVAVTLQNSYGQNITTNNDGNRLSLKTNANGEINLTNMPIDTYKVTQETKVDGLIKPGVTQVTMDATGGSVTLVNKYEAIAPDLPMTGSDQRPLWMIGSLIAFGGLTIALVLVPVKKHRE